MNYSILMIPSNLQKSNKRLFFYFNFFCVLLSFNLSAQLKPAGIFGDNAILQQGILIPVWGKARPSSIVSISLGINQLKVKTDVSGRWIGYLQPMVADGQTYQLKINDGIDSIIYSNIMIGEVWVASGQSNMEYRMASDLQDKEQELKNANYPGIRFRLIDNVTSIVPLDDIAQKDWKLCTSANAPFFSAVAYFFARSLYLDQKVPVGIIVASRGATGIETWMSKDRLITHPDFSSILNSRDEDSAHWNAHVQKSLKAEAERASIAKNSFNGLKIGVNQLNFDDSLWAKSNFPINAEKMGYNSYWGIIWFRKTFVLSGSEAGKKHNLFLPINDQNDHVYLNGKELAVDVSKLKNKSISISNEFLKEGTNVLAIRMYVNWGVAEIGNRNTNCYLQDADGAKILLDGEWKHSNMIEPSVAGWQDYYNKPTVNFNGMINPLIPFGIKGFLWYQGENNASKPKQYAELQPMLIDDWRVRWRLGYMPFLYVQLAGYKSRSATPVGKDDWAQFRDAQKSTLFMSFNTGMASAIDIGDEFNIHPGNKKDVGSRLYQVARKIAYHQNGVASGPLFKSAILEGTDIRISFSYTEDGIVNKGNVPLEGFAVSDSTGKWHWANASIDGQTIIVHCDNVSGPIFVQYAWQSNPATPLYNSAGLPMLPFNERVIQLIK